MPVGSLILGLVLASQIPSATAGSTPPFEAAAVRRGGATSDSPLPKALTFEAAEARLRASSPATRAAGYGRDAAQSQRRVAEGLNRPTVMLEAQLIRYRKTFDLSLGDVLDQAQSGISAAIPGLVQGQTGLPPDLLDQVEGRLQSSLPEIFASLPQDVRLQIDDTAFKPSVTAIQPIYTGGAIPALRRAAGASADLAEARLQEAIDLEAVNLARAYFGQVLASQAVQIAKDGRDGFDLHLHNARRMQEEGLLSRAQVLQVEVARDTAQRQLNRAEVDWENAVAALSNLLDLDQAVTPTTPLFVNRHSVGPADIFLSQADQNNAKLAQAQAGREIASAGADLAASRLKPSLFAFGTYSMNREDNLPTEPDWALGVAARYTLISSLDRRQMLSSARAQAMAAQETERQARDQIRLLVTRAYNQAELARRQFLSMDTSLAAASENLRVQEVGFREGEATASDVIDARNLLGNARLQRAAAAYEYNLSLAALLAATGSDQSLSDYQQRPDRISTP